MMKIGFIGAGRMGFTLGKYFTEHGLNVVGYFSRTTNSSEMAAQFTETSYFVNLIDIVEESDLLFITVNDNAIASVYKEIISYAKNGMINLAGKIFCHTSGALSSEVFTDSDKLGIYGYSVHPIYAVSDKLTSYLNFNNAFITIEGHEAKRDELLMMFKNMGNNCAVLDKENKAKYHAASVYASNFVCGIYGASKSLFMQCGFDDEMADMCMRGLFSDNASNIVSKGVISSLTGPAERADYLTVEKHLNAISGEERKTYIALTREVLKLAKVKNPDRDYEVVHAVLDKYDN